MIRVQLLLSSRIIFSMCLFTQYLWLTGYFYRYARARYFMWGAHLGDVIDRSPLPY